MKMKKHHKTDVEILEGSTATRRLLRREQLILDVTAALYEQMEAQGLKKADLARRLEKSPAFVTHLLAGDRNLTLKTIADLTDALNGSLKVRFVRSKGAVAWEDIETITWVPTPGWSDGQATANISDLNGSHAPTMANTSDLDVAA
jgi:transcriptional regulator with XRE-family HTH domain